MAIFKIGVKFCGNCNPRIDSLGLIERIKARLKQKVFWSPANGCDIDILIIVSGCQVDCASRNIPAQFTLMIAGQTLDGNQYSASKLEDQIIDNLGVIIHELERNL
ncbi:MAG: hypothetical protein ACOYVD_18605 [Bacillota bacterium]